MAPGARNPTVVIADDDALIRFVLRAALERSGYSVVDADDGESAVRLCRTAAVDAVILDARMPGLTLPETFTALRSDRGDLPILILSGISDPPDEAREPHTQFLSKPVDSRALIETVARLVGVGTE